MSRGSSVSRSTPNLFAFTVAIFAIVAGWSSNGVEAKSAEVLVRWDDAWSNMNGFNCPLTQTYRVNMTFPLATEVSKMLCSAASYLPPIWFWPYSRQLLGFRDIFPTPPVTSFYFPNSDEVKSAGFRLKLWAGAGDCDNTGGKAYQERNIQFASLPQNVWNRISARLDFGICVYAMQFSLLWMETSEPIVESLYPNGVELPAFPDDKEVKTYSLARKAEWEALWNISVFLFGPKIDARGEPVRAVYCRVFQTQAAQATGSYSSASNALEVSGTKLVEILPSTTIKGISRDQSYLQTLFDNEPIWQYYGTPSGFSQYSNFIECPQLLAQVRTYSGRQNLVLGKQLIVEVYWDRTAAFSAKSLSDNKRTFLLHGGFDITNTEVRIEPPKPQVFETATLMITAKWPAPSDVSSSDPTLLYRQNGHDLFWVEWSNGPALNPKQGIGAGLLANNYDGTYQVQFAMDYAGTYCVIVYWVHPTSFEFIPVGKSSSGCNGTSFDIFGLGAGAPDNGPESNAIAWADKLHRKDTDYWNPQYTTLISNNRGLADKADVLGPLFRRWGGGWFQQRETVSLSFAWPPLDADLLIPKRNIERESSYFLRTGAVHQILRQGIGQSIYCNQHVDPISDGVLKYDAYPWQQVRRLIGKQTATLTVPDLRDDVCVNDISLDVFLLLNPDLFGNNVQPYYRMVIAHNDDEVDVSGGGLNPLYPGTTSTTCCQTVWCTDSRITFSSYDTAFQQKDPVWARYSFDCTPSYVTDRTSVVWGMDFSSSYDNKRGWKDTPDKDVACTFKCTGATGTKTCDTRVYDCQPYWTSLAYAATTPTPSVSPLVRINGTYPTPSPSHGPTAPPPPPPSSYDCCTQVWCSDSITWDLFKKDYGPRGGVWDDYNFVCTTQGQVVHSLSGSRLATWKNDTGLNIKCTFNCPEAAIEPFQRQCASTSVDCSPTQQTAQNPVECLNYPIMRDYTLAQPAMACFESGNVPGFQDLIANPASGNWSLKVIGPSSQNLGTLVDWTVGFELQNCYNMPGRVTYACAYGPGSSNEEPGTDVHLGCPEGTFISNITDVRFGYPLGDCDNGFTPSPSCDYSTQLVPFIERECLGKESCELTADPALIGPANGSFSCPQVPCAPGSLAMCPGDKPFLKIKAICKSSSAAGFLSELQAPANPEQLIIKSVSGNFDGDPKEDVFTAYARPGGCIVVILKTVLGDGVSGQVQEVQYDWCSVRNYNIRVKSQISLASGDFDEDNYDEVAIAFDTANDGIKVLFWDLHADLKQPGCKTDCFWQGGQWSSSQWKNSVPMRSTFSNAQTFVFCPDFLNNCRLRPPAIAAQGFAFGIASGDFNFDINSEAAVVWIHDVHTVRVQVFDWQYYAQDGWDKTMVGQFSKYFELKGYTNPHAVGISIADLLGDGYDHILVVVADDNSITLQVVHVDPIRKFKLTGAKRLNVADTDPAIRIPNYFNVKIVSGDLNDDADDEIVIVHTTSSIGTVAMYDITGLQGGKPCKELSCVDYITAQSFTTGPAPTDPSLLARPTEIHFDIGNMDDSRALELVIVGEYRNTQPDTGYPATKVLFIGFALSNTNLVYLGKHCYAGPGYIDSDDPLIPNGRDQNEYIPNNIAMTIGNLYGMGLRVKNPEYWRFEGVPRLMAIINAPPTHVDFINEETVVVNPKTLVGADGSFASAQTSEGVTSQWSYVTEGASSVTSLNGEYYDLTAWVYKRHWDKVLQKIDSSAQNDGIGQTDMVAISKSISAAQDDVVMFISTNYDIWKYPIVDYLGTEIGTLDIRWPSSCGEDCIQVVSGRQLRWFRPNHQVFNVLSYSTRAPSDFSPSNRILVGDKVLVSSNPHVIWIDEQVDRVQSRTTQTDNKNASQTATNQAVGMSISTTTQLAFWGLGIGLDIGFDFKYGWENRNAQQFQTLVVNNKAAGFTKTASMMINLEAVDTKYSYWVQPFVYMVYPPDQPPYYVVDYTAEPNFEPGEIDWWQEVYNKPDPTFNLPWAYSNRHLSLTLRTKEMIYTPNPPILDQEIRVTFTVRNYSPVEARNVRVTFWKGDPSNCNSNQQCLQQARISIAPPVVIPKQGKATVERRWLFDGISNIYATIDDLNVIDEVHEDNNKAFGLIYTIITPEASEFSDTLLIGSGIGYLLQNLQLAVDENDNLYAGFYPVRDSGDPRIRGYNIKLKVIGDSLTRALIPVVFYLGDPLAAGSNAILIGSYTIPHVPAEKDTWFSVQWDVRALYGMQSGITVSPDNIISHIQLSKFVDCYVGFDACGVCGGDDQSCIGCDGIPNSGKANDRCGVCGGDSSSCCLLEEKHAIQLDEMTVSSTVLSIKIGDSVVWENSGTSTPHRIVGTGGDDRHEDDLLGFQVEPDLSSGVSYDVNSAAQFKDQLAKPQAAPPPSKNAGRNKAKSKPALTEKQVKFRKFTYDDIENDPLARWMVLTMPSRLGGTTSSSSNLPPRLPDFGVGSSPSSSTGTNSRRSVGGHEIHNHHIRHDGQIAVAVGGQLPDQPQRRQAAAPPAPAEAGSAPQGGAGSGGAGGASGDGSGGAPGESGGSADGTADAPKTGNKEEPATKGGGIGDLGAVSDIGGDISSTGITDVPGLSFSGSGMRGAPSSMSDFTTQLRNPTTQLIADNLITPGIRSLPVVFYKVGVYQWASDLYPVVGGTIVVSYNDPPLVVDECGVCGGDSSSCYDCAGDYKGEAFLDHCRVCSGGSTEHEADSDKDCAGVCFGSAYVDSCGECVGGGTGLEPNRSRDCAGVCFGNSSIICGQCFDFTNAETDADLIAQIPHNREVPWDCSGICKPPLGPGNARTDECGSCVEGYTGRTWGYALDCRGVCNGPAKFDRCGVCYGGTSPWPQTSAQEPCPIIGLSNVRFDGKATQLIAAVPCATDPITGIALYPDCMGVCMGSAFINDCFMCVGGTTGRDMNYGKDCAGVCRGSATLDGCGMCAGGASGRPAESARDCMKVCNGTAFLDACGVCSGGTSSHVANSDMDCAGTCFTGSAFIDECGQCAGGASGVQPGAAKDCAGQCFGSHVPTDEACNCNGTLDACFVCKGDNKSCAGCDGAPNSGLVYDICGVCDGDGSSCCVASDAGPHVRLDNFDSDPYKVKVVTGEPVYFENRHNMHSFTLVFYPPAGSRQPKQRLPLAVGHIDSVFFRGLGTYEYVAEEFPLITGFVEVYSYNKNKSRSCGCVLGGCFDSESATGDGFSAGEDLIPLWVVLGVVGGVCFLLILAIPIVVLVIIAIRKRNRSRSRGDRADAGNNNRDPPEEEEGVASSDEEGDGRFEQSSMGRTVRNQVYEGKSEGKPTRTPNQMESKTPTFRRDMNTSNELPLAHSNSSGAGSIITLRAK